MRGANNVDKMSGRKTTKGRSLGLSRGAKKAMKLAYKEDQSSNVSSSTRKRKRDEVKAQVEEKKQESVTPLKRSKNWDDLELRTIFLAVKADFDTLEGNQTGPGQPQLTHQALQKAWCDITMQVNA